MADKKEKAAKDLDILNSRRKSIYKRLTGKYELDNATSLAILANLEWESGGKLNPKRRQGRLGGSNQKMSEESWCVLRCIL